MSANKSQRPRGEIVPALLDRQRLIERWQHGSDAFFWRHETSGALIPRSDGTKLRYAWDDIYRFEGGQPPEGLQAAYQSGLLTEAQAAALCSVTPSYILAAARKGDLPVRRIGRAFRFVPAELDAWQSRRFANGKSRRKRKKSQNE